MNLIFRCDNEYSREKLKFTLKLTFKYFEGHNRNYNLICKHLGLPQVVLVVKNPPANAGDMGSVLELGRSPAGGNGNPLQYSCLENPMDQEGWQVTVRGVTKC